MATQSITIHVNGEARTAEVEDRLLLVHFIRDNSGLTGTHIGCDTTHCGACTILLERTRGDHHRRYGGRSAPSSAGRIHGRTWSSVWVLHTRNDHVFKTSS